MKYFVRINYSHKRVTQEYIIEADFPFFALEHALAKEGKFWQWEAGKKHADGTLEFHAHKGKLFTKRRKEATAWISEREFAGIGAEKR